MYYCSSQIEPSDQENPNIEIHLVSLTAWSSYTEDKVGLYLFFCHRVTYLYAIVERYCSVLNNLNVRGSTAEPDLAISSGATSPIFCNFLRLIQIFGGSTFQEEIIFRCLGFSSDCQFAFIYSYDK